ncbi:hypothetical protein WL35_05825 [Burkholderia ubonensis]|nr:hypothetical protein WL35_05825 [Burkholderia ubonensis]
MIYLPGQFLGLAPKVHSPELVDLCLQTLDFVVASSDLPHHVRDRCLLFAQRCFLREQRRLLREHPGLELGDGSGKRRIFGQAAGCCWSWPAMSFVEIYDEAFRTD